MADEWKITGQEVYFLWRNGELITDTRGAPVFYPTRAEAEAVAERWERDHGVPPAPPSPPASRDLGAEAWAGSAPWLWRIPRWLRRLFGRA